MVTTAAAIAKERQRDPTKPDVPPPPVVVEPVVVIVDDSELDAPDVPAVDEDAGGLRDRLYLVPGKPGRLGSSRAPDFLFSITTTRRMVGRWWGSDWVHNNPIRMQADT